MERSDNPYLDWCTHLFTAERVQYILVTNTQSLYSTLLRGKVIVDLDSFIRRLRDNLEQRMTEDGFQLIWQRHVAL